MTVELGVARKPSKRFSPSPMTCSQRRVSTASACRRSPVASASSRRRSTSTSTRCSPSTTPSSNAVSAAHLAVMRTAMARAEPGLDALAAGLDASGRWALNHPATAQLLFWHSVPNFEPTPEAMAPSIEMVNLQRQALADAAAAGQLGAGADSDEALWITSILVSGVIGQAMANEPGLPWGEGRFSPLLPKLLNTLAGLYPRSPPAADRERDRPPAARVLRVPIRAPTRRSALARRHPVEGGRPTTPHVRSGQG